MDDMDTRVSALEASLDGARGATEAFQAELSSMGTTMGLAGREVDGLGRQVGNGLRRAFDGMATDGVKLSDALRQVSRSMVDAVYSASVRPVQGALGGVVSQGVQSMMQSFLPFAAGGGFSQGRVMPFADGGIVNGPVAFPMRGGQTGLMGEAGPEAILPLARGADGRLGVQAQSGGGGPVSVTINVSTPDLEGFRRSEGQIAGEIGRMIARGQRNR